MSSNANSLQPSKFPCSNSIPLLDTEAFIVPRLICGLKLTHGRGSPLRRQTDMLLFTSAHGSR